MILQTGYRFNGIKTEFPSKKQKPVEALQSLLVYELGYGGHVYGLCETSISVSTSVLGCVDNLTWQGSTKDMAMLVKAASAHVLLSKDYAKEFQDTTLKLLEGALGDKVGVPFYFCNMAPIVHGGLTSISALFAAFDMPNDESKFAIEFLGSSFRSGYADRFEDLIAACELYKETGQSLREILA